MKTYRGRTSPPSLPSRRGPFLPVRFAPAPAPSRPSWFLPAQRLLGRCPLSRSLLGRSLLFRSLLGWSLLFRSLLFRSLLGRSLLFRSLPFRFLLGRSLLGRSLLGRSLLGRSLLGRSLLGRSLLSRSLLARPSLARFLLAPSLLGLCLVVPFSPPAAGGLPWTGPAGAHTARGDAPTARPPVVGPATAAAPAGSAFRWPLPGVPRPVRRFDPPPRPWLPGHRGVDLAAQPGVAVLAAGAGVVLFAGPVAGRPVVTVVHSGGLRTTYEPVRPAVRTGDRVVPGDRLGVLLPGHPGCAVDACLHWGLRRGDIYLDPLSLLGLGRVRLLTVEPESPG